MNAPTFNASSHLRDPARDWTEDASHENGNYLCRCCGCHETFVGHKRRTVCKVCHDKDDAEAKLRAEWLTAHSAPKDWVVLTIDEVRKIRADYSNLLLRYHVEQNVRRDLVTAYDRLAGVVDGHPAAHYPVADAREVLRKARNLDLREMGAPPDQSK